MFYRKYGKVVFDYILSLLLLPFFLVIIFVAGTVNVFFVGWPVFFTQERVGKNGKIFKIYKLRTMSGVGGSSKFASAEQHRITSFGKLLRKARIDELPQIINILKGEMSLIGPRPEQPSFVERYSEIIANYDKRHVIKPGLTGLAQIENGYTDNDDGTRNKVEYDLLYVRKLNFSTDLNIMYKTIFEVVQMTG